MNQSSYPTLIKEIIDDIQRGGNRMAIMRTLFPENMKGSMAKQYWHDSMFTYGVEYGALIVLTYLLGDYQSSPTSMKEDE